MPRFIIAGALLFWGWHTGLWWLALPLALLAELPARMHWHWELELKERQRVADLCTVLIVLAGGYLYLNQPRLGVALIVLIQWLPALVFPLLAVQLFGRHKGLELSVLFLSLRGDKPHGNDTLDLRWTYVLLCVISASMIPPDTVWFFPSLVLLALWALSPTPRPGQPAAERGRTLRRLAALTLAAIIGIGLSAALRWGHDEIELIVQRWVEQWMGTGLDPYRSTTAIGEVGTLKGSDRIRLRVYTHEPINGLLLRTASYDRYVNGTWFTTGSPFEPVSIEAGRALIGDTAPAAATAPAASPITASIDPVAADTRELRILLQLQRPEGLLPLPTDAISIERLEGIELHRNVFGTIRYRLQDKTALLGYRVTWGSRPPPLAPPDAIDLRVLGPESTTLARVAAELKLADLAPADALRRLLGYFDKDFRYTLELPRIPADQPPLSHFLLQARAGHCEYFASAAALLLRQAGIPARYARGWSVQEYSPLEEAWISRDSHAHAWVLAWIDGAWRNFDPTPPDWGALEAADRPWTLGASDFVAWLRLKLSGAGNEDRADRNWLLLPLAVLILILAWRIARRARRGSRHRRQALAIAAKDKHAFSAIELAAVRHGLGRRPAETLQEWAERIAREQSGAGSELRDAVGLHYRDRFDPQGIDADTRVRLTRLLASCLRRWR